MQNNSITTSILKYLKSVSIDGIFVKRIPNSCMPVLFCQHVLPSEKCYNNCLFLSISLSLSSMQLSTGKKAGKTYETF